MTIGLPKYRKQRTRQHVIAAQSVNYVERFIVDSGHTAQRVEYDYGYDLLITTFDEAGFEEPGLIYLQLKATDSLKLNAVGTEVIFEVNSQAVSAMRDWKQGILEQSWGRINHA